MNNDLISRKALKKQIKDSITEYGNTYSNDLLNGLGMVLQMLDNAPTVDIKDQIAGAYNEGYMCGNKEAEKARPQGEWKVDGCLIACNKCGRILLKASELYNFCPNCGAKMKGGTENE